MFHGKTKITAILKEDTHIPQDYAINQIKGYALFGKSYMAWAIYTRDNDDPIRMKIEHEVQEYNNIINEIHKYPTFTEFFKDNNLAVTRNQITEQFGEELANNIFKMKRYSFQQSLYTSKDWLCSIECRPIYTVSTGKETIQLQKYSSDLYALNKSENENYIFWNLTEDERDATYYICCILEQMGFLENLYDDETIDYNYNWYDCYEQAQDDINHPDIRLMKIMELLETNGYLKSYSVLPETFHPSWSYDFKSDGTADWFILESSFIENIELSNKIRNIVYSIPTTSVYD